ncbi:MAG: hypothetical protein LBH03_00465 [Holophagales bacterium]|jgi:hypothetical protein|nr:hypothetical protein [Holophagales bacterium]
MCLLAFLLTAKGCIGLLRLQAQSVEVVLAGNLRLLDVSKKGNVFSFTRGLGEEAAQFSGSVKNAIKGHLGFLYGALEYAEMRRDQYEPLCDLLSLPHKFTNDILIIYYNNNGVQLSYDVTTTNLLHELSKLGWEPLEERLQEFLKRNPNNQDALLLWYVVNFRKIETGNTTIRDFTKVIEMVNKSRSISWLDSTLATITMINPIRADKASPFKDDARFQKGII